MQAVGLQQRVITPSQDINNLFRYLYLVCNWPIFANPVSQLRTYNKIHIST